MGRVKKEKEREKRGRRVKKGRKGREKDTSLAERGWVGERWWIHHHIIVHKIEGGRRWPKQRFIL